MNLSGYPYSLFIDQTVVFSNFEIQDSSSQPDEQEPTIPPIIYDGNFVNKFIY